jgi:hypothetical protein
VLFLTTQRHSITRSLQCAFNHDDETNSFCYNSPFQKPIEQKTGRSPGSPPPPPTAQLPDLRTTIGRGSGGRCGFAVRAIPQKHTSDLLSERFWPVPNGFRLIPGQLPRLSRFLLPFVLRGSTEPTQVSNSAPDHACRQATPGGFAGQFSRRGGLRGLSQTAIRFRLGGNHALLFGSCYFGS